MFNYKQFICRKYVKKLNFYLRVWRYFLFNENYIETYAAHFPAKYLIRTIVCQTPSSTRHPEICKISSLRLIVLQTVSSSRHPELCKFPSVVNLREDCVSNSIVLQTSGVMQNNVIRRPSRTENIRTIPS